MIGTAIAVVAASAAASSVRFTRELLEFGLAWEIPPTTQSGVMDPAHRICKGGRNDPRILDWTFGLRGDMGEAKAALAEATKIRPEVNCPARRRKYSPGTAAPTKEIISSKRRKCWNVSKRMGFSITCTAGLIPAPLAR
jgi:hypothetical protein